MRLIFDDRLPRQDPRLGSLEIGGTLLGDESLRDSEVETQPNPNPNPSAARETDRNGAPKDRAERAPKFRADR